MEEIQKREQRINENRKMAQELLKKAMDPNSVLEYLPKPSASSVLQDMMYNFSRKQAGDPNYEPIQLQRYKMATGLHEMKQRDILGAHQAIQTNIQEENNALNQMRYLSQQQNQAAIANAQIQGRNQVAQIGAVPKLQLNLLKQRELELVKMPDSKAKRDLEEQQTAAIKQNIETFGGNVMKAYFDANGPITTPEELEAAVQLQQRLKGLGIPTVTTSQQYMTGPDSILRPYPKTTVSVKGGGLVPPISSPAFGATKPEKVTAPEPAKNVPPTPLDVVNRQIQKNATSTGALPPPVTPAVAKRNLESKDLTPKGAEELANISAVRRQYQSLQDWFEKNKNKNTPLMNLLDYAKYRVGIDPNDDAKNVREMSKMAETLMAQVQAIRPLMSGQRSNLIYEDLKKHVPNPALDSGQNLYKKAMGIQRNYWRIEAAVRTYMTKYNTGTGENKPPISKDAVDFYKKLNGGNAGAARADAINDGWDVSKKPE